MDERRFDYIFTVFGKPLVKNRRAGYSVPDALGTRRDRSPWLLFSASALTSRWKVP